MLLQVKIRLTSPLLGDKMNTGGVRGFTRTKQISNDEVPLDSALWVWAITQAAESLNIKITGDMFRIPAKIQAPTLNLYNRRWTTKAGKKKVDMFESIRAGSVLTIPILLFSAVPGNNVENSVISEQDFIAALALVGTFIGVSPWGSKFGYGRFEILEETKEVARDV